MGVTDVKKGFKPRTRMNRRMLESFIGFLCDAPAGEDGTGMSRWVYTSEVFPDIVIKIERRGKVFQNIVEYETWTHVEHTWAAQFFAPVVDISDCGRFLVMKRTKPVTMKTLRKTTRVPVFLSDLKRTNYGLYKGRLVCHDYGTNLLRTYGLGVKFKKAGWIDS